MSIATRLLGALQGFASPPQRRQPATWEDGPADSSMRPPAMPADVMRRRAVSLAPGLEIVELPDGRPHVQPEPPRWTQTPPAGPGWFEVVWHSVVSDSPPIRIAEVVASPERPLGVINAEGAWEQLSSVKWWGRRVELSGPPPSEPAEEGAWR